MDIAVQELLREKLLKLENAQFLGEESETDIDWASPAWVVDPIDGTTNLMHGTIIRQYALHFGTESR